MTNEQKIKELYKILDQIDLYHRVAGKLNFDIECVCPKNGLEQATLDMNDLGQVIFKLSHSKKYITLVKELKEDSIGLTEYQKKCVDNLYKYYVKEKNVTAKLNYQMSKAYGDAYIHWLEAKEKNDYKGYVPYFKKVIEISKKELQLREVQCGSLYDTNLNDFEEGLNCEKLDEFFGVVKKELVPLIAKINNSKKVIRRDFITRNVPISKQEKFSHYLNEHEGLEMDSLVLMTTEHPFTTGFGEKDERITTHYYENAFFSNIFSCMHEGGHALFDLGEPHEFFVNHINNQMTMSMHECMSRLFENMIGRSKSFIKLIYPELMKTFGDELGDVSEEEMYEAANIVENSLIRTEADELTYPLHILIRYELEKEIVNGNVDVKTLNKKWNEKYKEYLGIDVPSDSEGILQDVHWTSGFGYFPSYALGSAYAAQIMHTMRQQIDVDKLVEEDNIAVIRDWLKEHAWRYASIMNTEEWLIKVTGEKFNPYYYVNYLKEKFTRLYELED